MTLNLDHSHRILRYCSGALNEHQTHYLDPLHDLTTYRCLWCAQPASEHYRPLGIITYTFHTGTITYDYTTNNTLTPTIHTTIHLQKHPQQTHQKTPTTTNTPKTPALDQTPAKSHP